MIKLTLTREEFLMVRLGIAVLINSPAMAEADTEALTSLIGKFVKHLKEMNE